MKKLTAFILCLVFAGLNAMEQPPVTVVLFPVQEAAISAKLDSTLEVCHFRPGEPFEKGAVLAELDKRPLQLEAERIADQAAFAEAAYLDQKGLFEKKFTSEYELKKREYELKNIRNQLKAIQLQLSFCTVKAPFAGTIEEIKTKEHETVRAGQVLFKLIDAHALYAVMNVPLTEFGHFRKDTEITIYFPEIKKNAKGKIVEIAPRADHRSGTIQLKALIDNRDGSYRAGLTGELRHERRPQP